MLAAAACQAVLMLQACRETSSGGVREAVFAGSWYRDTEDGLTAEVDGYLAKAQPPVLPGKVAAMISPHAGYAYSGRAAAHGYNAVSKGDYDVVVVMAPAHRWGLSSTSV